GAVARQYAAFLEAVVEGKKPRGTEQPPVPVEAAPAAELPEVEQYLRGWAVDEASRNYLDTHRTRLVRTLEITPAGGPEDRILEMGAYLHVTPALRNKLGYSEVRG